MAIVSFFYTLICKKFRIAWIIFVILYAVIFLMIWKNVETQENPFYKNCSQDLSQAFDLFYHSKNFSYSQNNTESLLFQSVNCFIPKIYKSMRNYEYQESNMKYLETSEHLSIGDSNGAIKSELDDFGTYIQISNGGGKNENQIDCYIRKIGKFDVNGYNRIIGLSEKSPFEKIRNISKPFMLEPRRLVKLICGEKVKDQSESVTHQYSNKKESNQRIDLRLFHQCYENIHYSIPSRRNISKFWKTFKHISNSKPPLSIILIGIESLLSVNFQAELPNVYNILNQYATKFPGFTSLGMEKLDNIIPLLTGIEYKNWKEYCDTSTEKDLINFPCDIDKIGIYLRSLNYETMYLENFLTQSGKRENGNYVYNNLQRYFDIVVKKSEGVHSLQNYQMVKIFSMQNGVSNWDQFGDMFSFAIKFWKKFEKNSTPSYSNIWLKSLFKNRKAIDKYLSEYLATVIDNGQNKDTLIIFYGTTDYSWRDDPLNEFYEGELNSRLPVLYIRFPKTLDIIASRFYEAFKRNTESLISPYDLHETLNSAISLAMDVLTTSRVPEIQQVLKQVKNGQNDHDWMKIHGTSLINTLVSMKRTCSSAGIPISLCPCSQNRDSSLSPISSHISVSIIAKKVLKKVYSDLSRDSEFKSLCTEWKLELVINSTRLAKGDMEDLYEIYFLSSPADAIFKVQILYKPYKFRYIKSSFKRMNPKPIEAYCIGEEKDLSKLFAELCYCNE